ncbi:MAG: cobalamin ABC transporter substrate-binding protein [Byssovorax sp.]
MNPRSLPVTIASAPWASLATPLRFTSIVLLAGALFGIAGCGEATPVARLSEAAGLPKWDGHARELFDDNIDPAAVGLSMEGPAPRSDPFLRERSQTAAVTARVRVQTVTIDSIGDQKTYHLGVQVGFPTLTIARVPDKSFELSIRASSSAFGIAKAFEARLRGATFIGFVGRFEGDDGEVEVHFHLAPDTADVATAVKESVALQELGAQ